VFLLAPDRIQHPMRVHRLIISKPSCSDGLLAFSTVALTTLAPKMLGSYRQRFAIYIWVGVTIFIFSFLVKVFKIKNGGDPFRLLLG
jgi:multisubunit Na+/H+ antiporter MnhF subunit